MAKQEEASKEEQIGFHKGALSTLAKERQEMAKIIQVVEQLMQMHVTALKELGVDLQKQAEELMKDSKNNPKSPAGKPKKPIEDLLRK